MSFRTRAGCGCLLVVALTGLVAWLSHVPRAAADPTCTVTWTGAASDGAWMTAGNWSTDAVPDASDVACIPSGQAVTISAGTAQASTVLADGATVDLTGGSFEVSDMTDPSTIGTLSIAGGELTGAASVTVSSSLSWTDGTMSGSGATVLGADATGTIAPASSAAQPLLDARTLDNEGALTFDCSQANDPLSVFAVLSAADAAQVTNAGTLSLGTSSTGQSCELQQTTGAAVELDNTGTLDVDASEAALGWELVSSNTATVSVPDSDDLVLLAGEPTSASEGGTWEGSGSVLLGAGGAYTFAADSVVSTSTLVVQPAPDSSGGQTSSFVESATGASSAAAASLSAGAVSWPDATISVSGTASLGDGSADVTVGGLSVASGAGMTLAGDAALGTLSVAGGQLTAANIAVSSTLDWTGGTIDGSGTLTVGSAAKGTIEPTAGAAPVALSGEVLSNEGQLTLECDQANDPTQSYSMITGSDGAQIANAGTMTIDVVTNWSSSTPGPFGCELQQGGGAAAVLANTGTLRQSNGGEDLIGWQFSDGADASVQNATLELYGGQPTATPLSGDLSTAYLDLLAGGTYHITESAQAPEEIYIGGGISGSEADYTEWLAGNADSPGLSEGAVAWPDTNIAAAGPATIGNTTTESTLASLSAQGYNAPNSVTYTEPATDPDSTPSVENYVGTNGSQVQLTLNGDISAPNASLYLSGGHTSLTGDESSFSTLGFEACCGEAPPVLDQQGALTIRYLYGGQSAAAGTLTGSGTTTVTAYTYSAFTVDDHTIHNASSAWFYPEQIVGTNGATIDNDGTIDDIESALAAPSANPPQLINETDGTLTGNSSQPGLMQWAVTNHGTLDPAGVQFEGPVDGAGQFEWTRYGLANPARPHQLRPMCGGQVSCATGNQVQVQTDFSAAGLGGPLALTRTYNSQLAESETAPGMFGYGWTTPFDAHLFTDAATATAVVEQGNGSTAGFTVGPGGSWTPDAGNEATLTTNDDGTYRYELPGHTVLTFASDGTLASEADRAGNVTTLTYNSSGQLTTVIAPSGRQITFTYNTDGLVATATDPSGLTVSYGYDETGDLQNVSYPTGVARSWALQYDGDHDLQQIQHADGHTNISYDDSRVSFQADALSRDWRFSYAAGQTLTTSPAGNVTQDLFDVDDNAVSVTQGYGAPDQSTKTLAYNSGDEPTQLTDGNDHTSTFGYDTEGDLTSEIDANSHETQWAYDDAHNATSMTLPSGEETTYGYNEQNLITSATRTLTGSPDQTVSTGYGYNSVGEVVSVTDPRGHAATYGYDEQGDLTSITTPTGNQTTREYDADGRVVSSVAPAGNATGGDPLDHTTTWGYDPLGELTTVTDPLGDETTYAYDGDGNETSTTDPDENTTSYSYDADDELTQTTRPDSTVLSYGYDADGNLTSRSDGAGNTTTYSYTPLDQLATVSDGLSRQTSYAYDLAGNLATVTDPDARTTTDGYNPGNELTSISYSDTTTPDVAFSYNADGTRESMTDGTGTSDYTYDSLDRMTSATNGDGQIVSYGYDLDGDVTSLGYPASHTLTRTFDDDDRLASVEDWLGHTTTFGYDADSNLQTTTFPSATTDLDTDSYNDADQVTAIQMSQGATTLASVALTRDSAGLVSNGTQTGLPGSASTDYAYTPLDQLRSAAGDEYAYDGAGDATELGGVDGYGYDAADELNQSPAADYAYDDFGGRVGVTPATSSLSYTYDSLGRLTTVTQGDAATEDGAAFTYGYDQAERLVSATPATGTATSYAYDGDGLRASKTTGSATEQYAWDQAGAMPLLLSDGSTEYIYGPDGQPLEQIDSSGTPSYLHPDQIGSTRLITDASGDPTGAFTYSPYGILAASSGSAATALGFAGQYTDAETGLQYDRTRYYDPFTAQFLTPEAATNMQLQSYSYADDSPLNQTEPDGTEVKSEPMPPGGSAAEPNVIPPSGTSAAGEPSPEPASTAATPTVTPDSSLVSTAPGLEDGTIGGPAASEPLNLVSLGVGSARQDGQR